MMFGRSSASAAGASAPSASAENTINRRCVAVGMNPALEFETLGGETLAEQMLTVTGSGTTRTWRLRGRPIRFGPPFGPLAERFGKRLDDQGMGFVSAAGIDHGVHLQFAGVDHLHVD